MMKQKYQLYNRVKYMMINSSRMKYDRKSWRKGLC